MKQKKATIPVEEEDELLKQMRQQKVQREIPFLHYECDTDVEELYE
jgi:type III secretion system FlhB-like substrate exporter